MLISPSACAANLLVPSNTLHAAQLINFIVRRGILLGSLYSVIGRNVLNCALRYHISLDSIKNTDI